MSMKSRKSSSRYCNTFQPFSHLNLSEFPYISLFHEPMTSSSIASFWRRTSRGIHLRRTINIRFGNGPSIFLKIYLAERHALYVFAPSWWIISIPHRRTSRSTNASIRILYHSCPSCLRMCLIHFLDECLNWSVKVLTISGLRFLNNPMWPIFGSRITLFTLMISYILDMHMWHYWSLVPL